jgi:type IV secretion system protein VirD4
MAAVRGNERDTDITLAVVGSLIVLWFSLLIAPFTDGGLPEIIKNLPSVTEHPFSISFCGNTLKTVFVLQLPFWLTIAILISGKEKKRQGEEHGSAQWGSPRRLNRKYSQEPPYANKILTQNVRIGFDGRKHMRNLNTLVVGGSGSGKTRFVVKPNILQAGSVGLKGAVAEGASMIILDPKSEALRSTGSFLEKCGYEIRVLDLIDMPRSHCYNPFVYLENDNDVQRLVTNLFKSTTPKDAQVNDPFWDNSAMMLLSALVYYLHYEAPPEEQNFAMVMDMIRAGTIEDEEDPSPTPLDCLFLELQNTNPEHIALKYYRSYHGGAAKTLKSIQITLSSRLEKFNLVSLASLTMTDELDLSSIGEKRVALFAVIPDNDTSFNFIVSILYTQLFQQLFACADQKHGGSLPVPVHFLLDEFANVAHAYRKISNHE